MMAQKMKKMWEMRMLRKKRESGRREVFLDTGGESLELSEEVVPPQVVYDVEEEEEVIFLCFVDGSGKDVIEKARESALKAKRKAKRKEERHLKISAALEAKEAPEKSDKVEGGRSPFELRLREAKTYKEYKALKRAFKAKEGP